MRYRIAHETRYRYAEPVSLCQNVLRLHPRERIGQACIRCEVSVWPAPASRAKRIDFFGNDAIWISVDEPHTELIVTARSEVEVALPPPPPDGSTLPWELARELFESSHERDLIRARQFAFDSPHVPRSDELAAYAAPSFAPGRPLLDAAVELSTRIHREFAFVPGVTAVDTPVCDVLRHRRGVCQDFAHVLIGCLRSLGLAARYVSGYLATTPPPGKPRLVGADASHAWVSLHVPGVGWIDLDPTNGVLPSESHVTIAWARDYDDVSPVNGIIVGGGRHSLGVSVDVVPIDA